MDLDEIPTEKLISELVRRRLCYDVQQCPYCKTKLSAHTCKFKDAKTIQWSHDVPQRLGYSE